jgi:ribosomal protein S18 acetylase RimI-like enzyme
MSIIIRRAASDDVEALTSLVALKRAELERTFYRYQVEEDSVILLVAEIEGRVAGFINGILQNAPPVYDPGGKALMVDDFVVEAGDSGDRAALALLDAVKSEGRARGAVQMILVSAARDERAAGWFRAKGLHVASTWWNCVLSH